MLRIGLGVNALLGRDRRLKGEQIADAYIGNAGKALVKLADRVRQPEFAALGKLQYRDRSEQLGDGCKIEQRVCAHGAFCGLHPALGEHAFRKTAVVAEFRRAAVSVGDGDPRNDALFVGQTAHPLHELHSRSPSVTRFSQYTTAGRALSRKRKTGEGALPRRAGDGIIAKNERTHSGRTSCGFWSRV